MPRMSPLLLAVLVLTACAHPEHPEPPLQHETVHLTLAVPAEFSTVRDGACTADIRTVPFNETSDVRIYTTDQGTGGEHQRASTVLGLGASLPDGACLFSPTAPRAAFAPETDVYRIEVESATHSLVLSWDYPGSVVAERSELSLPLNDRVLRW